MRDPATGSFVGLNALSSLASSGITAPATTKVHVCRRASGSRTQAQLNALFLGSGCSSNGVFSIPDNTPWSSVTGGTGVTGGINTLGTTVHDNLKASDVDSCMTNLQAANYWAVGVQSLEYGNANYRYIAIDGVAPTLKNVGLTRYWDWAANTIQWKGSVFSGDKLNILNKIVDEISKPSSIASLNTSFNPRIVTSDD